MRHFLTMQNSHDDQAQPPKSLTDIISHFREVKHDLNNSLGVIMALSELAEKKPESITKLKDVVLTRAPAMVSSLQKVADELQQFAARNPDL